MSEGVLVAVRERVVRLLVTGLVATAVTVVPTSAQAVDDAVPVPVPRAERWQPRGAGIAGESPDGVVLVRESDPTSPWLRGEGEAVLRAADGSETPVDPHASRVFGDRLVGWTTWNKAISSLLPDGPLETLDVPQGHSLVAITGDGLLLASGASGERSLAVLPWDGSGPLPITGLPSGIETIRGPENEDDGAADPRGAVVTTWWSGGAESEAVYVDTRTRTAWPLGFTGRGWGLGTDTIAWLTTDGNGAAIGTVPRPSDTQPASPVTTRALPDTSAWGSSPAALLPVGDDVVVWRGGLGWGQYSPGLVAPVVAVAPDGTRRDLVGWGHDVRRASDPDGVLLVGGDDPASSDVLRLDVATGSRTVVAPLDTVAAHTTQVAVDDDRLAYVDNSAADGAFLERPLTPGAGGSVEVGQAQALGKPVSAQTCWQYPSDLCSPVVAGDGSLAWLSGSGSAWSWGLRDADGSVRTGLVPGAVSADGLTAVSGPWMLFDGTYLLDSRDNTVTKVAPLGGADLLDGVLYLPGSVVDTAPEDVVIVRDLDAGTVDPVSAPTCLHVHDVQAAGSWLLLTCSTAEGSGALVVDRTGSTEPRLLELGTYRLGNGFVVRRGDGDLVSWLPLSDPAADWRDLGTTPQHWAATSVSTGSVPLVSWIDRTGQAFVARVPVAPSALPAHPTTHLARPRPAVVTTDAYDGRVTVTWSGADPADQLTGYVVEGGVDRFQKELGPSTTTASFRGMKNGTSYSFTVTAQNLAGETSTTVQATPLGRPTAPENITVTVDEVTSTAHVSWTWWRAPATEDATSFDIWVGQPVATDLPPSARSATVTVPWPGTDPVTVVTNSEHGSSSADSAPVTFPGVDTTAPSVVTPRVPAVRLARDVTVPLRARDDRGVASMDLRWRSAASGARLGAWSLPSAWQRRAPGRVTVNRLRRGHTYCFSSRARDAAGNVSRWTAQRCTTVALDDRALARTGEWRLPTGRRFYLRTASTTASRVATLRRNGVRADAAYLVATTCPTCGTIRVQVGNDDWGKVRLRSAVRRDRRVVALPWPMRLRGRLIIRPVPGSGPVTIDGIALRSY